MAGAALRSWPIDEGAKQVEVVLHTDGRQLNAKIELLNAPNNPKQVSVGSEALGAQIAVPTDLSSLCCRPSALTVTG